MPEFARDESHISLVLKMDTDSSIVQVKCSSMKKLSRNKKENTVQEIVSSETLKLTPFLVSILQRKSSGTEGWIKVHPPAWNYLLRGAKYIKPNNRTLCPCAVPVYSIVKGRCTFIELIILEHIVPLRGTLCIGFTVAVRWVMFMRLSDFLSHSQLSTWRIQS